MIDALVTGRSVPALIAALDLAEVGLRVTVASDDREWEPPPAPTPDPDGLVRRMLERIAAPIGGTSGGPNDAVRPQVLPSVSPMLRDASGSWAAQAEPNVWGIPASPLATEVQHLLGSRGATRAYLDRLLPLLTVGKTRELGVLARKRLGAPACERLVEPLVQERFGVPAAAVEVALAAPGLNEALSRVGSLTAAALAYSERHASREARVAPAGGEPALHDALRRRLELFGVRFADAAVESVHPGDAWQAVLSDGETIRARALVLDAGRSAVPTRVQRHLAPALAPQRVRALATAALTDAAGVPAGASGLIIAGGWALRITAGSGDSGPTVWVAGPASDPQDPPAHLRASLDEVLAAAGMPPAQEGSWRVGLAVAPWATADERERDLALRAAWQEQHPDAIAVGHVLAGDDLGVAVEQATTDAVRLRRHLTGIVT